MTHHYPAITNENKQKRLSNSSEIPLKTTSVISFFINRTFDCGLLEFNMKMFHQGSSNMPIAIRFHNVSTPVEVCADVLRTCAMMTK